MFEGRSYVVTGGGSGIGAATARIITADGGSVVIVDASPDWGGKVTDELNAAWGDRAVLLVGDVADPALHVAAVDLAVSTFGGLDGAVNNAATGPGPGRLHETATASWDRTIAVTFSGVFHGMHAQLPRLLENGGGAIVNTLSLAAFRPVPDQGAYVAAKYGVLGLTEQAAMEYVDDHIRVNAVAPGLVATSFWPDLTDEQQDQANAGQPGGRVARPEEIAEVICFLLSDRSSYVNGDCIKVENGKMLRFG